MNRLFLILICILFSLPMQAQAAKRLALVVGNDSYRHISTLRNARADARAVAKVLEVAGFEVTVKLDLGDKALKEALRNFKAQVNGGDDAVFYFSGHGVQLGAANYLLPVDIAGENEDQVKDDALPLQRVLDDLQDQKARFTLAIVDACRNNPFKGPGRNIGGRGLQPVNPATGQMVLYSAGAGQQALDRLDDRDRNPNGVFTRILIKEMNQPGVSVDQVLREVRDQVVMLTKGVNHDQVPALYDQAVGRFYLVPGNAAQPRPAPPAPRPDNTFSPAAPPVIEQDPGESAYWSEVKKSEDADYYAAYLATYPSGHHVADANEYIQRDKQAKAAKEKLKEDQAWQKAQSGESYASYEAYLNAYHSGRYAAVARLKRSKLRPPVLEPEMVRIPGKDYEMGKYEVTQVQWRSVMDTNPSYFSNCGEDCPVEKMSLVAIQNYLNTLNELTGKQYRLPTEAEWKHACDGGLELKYCGANDLDAVGWYLENSGSKTHPVGQKQANGYGLYDMSGNVAEWQQDCYDGNCSVRILRGGSWLSESKNARAAIREGNTTSIRVGTFGFRVVRAASNF